MLSLLEQCIKSLDESTRINAILGDIYRFPFYLRLGYDRAPFGRHASEIIPASHTVTQHIISNPGAIISMGAGYTWASHHLLHASISLTGPLILDYPLLSEAQREFIRDTQRWSPKDYQADLERRKREINTKNVLCGLAAGPFFDLTNPPTQIQSDKELNEIEAKYRKIAKQCSQFDKALNAEDTFNLIFNVRYQKRSSTPLAHLIMLDRFTVGLGLGVDDNRAPLFNFNSDIDFAQYYHFKFEYLYHGSLNLFGLGSALHTEWSRHFSTKIPLLEQPLFGAIVGGYELGHSIDDTGNMRPENNLFVAGKFQVWKRHITLILGRKLSLYDHVSRTQPLIKLNVNLL
jgi:hypothetical protein